MDELKAVGTLEQVFCSLWGMSLNIPFARQQIEIEVSMGGFNDKRDS